MMNETILLVEDNQMNMELIVDLLSAAGYVVLQASDARQGLALAQSACPDLILMDISMPGMDGLHATQVLRKDPRTHGIPVVALTANAMEGDEEEAIAAGCAGYLAKPINTRTFVQTVAQFIRPDCLSAPSTV